MKILFITNRFPPLVDGVGDYTYNLAKEFVRHGHEVVVACSQNSRVVEGNHDGMYVYPIVTNWDRNAGKKIVCIAKQHNIDIVSLQYVPHGFHPKGLPFGLIMVIKEIRISRMPIFTFFHEIYPGYGKWYDIKQNLSNYLIAYISHRIANESTIIATSIGCYRNRLKRMNFQNISVIPIPSNIPPKQYSNEDIKRIRESIANHNETIITLFGNRNFSSVIIAIQKMIEQGNKIKIVALGSVNDTIPRGKSYIVYTGVLKIHELADYLIASDILILPENTKSGCSLKSGVLAAAIQFGIPTITVKGFLTDSKIADCVVFAKSDAPEEYERLILKLQSNDRTRFKLKEACQILAKELTWTNTYDNYIHLYSKYLDEIDK